MQTDAFESLSEARLRPAGSGLCGSAAHAALRGQQNAPAACGRLRSGLFLQRGDSVRILIESALRRGPLEAHAT